MQLVFAFLAMTSSQKGRPLVGRSSPDAPQVLRPGGRRPLRPARRLPLGPPRLRSSRRSTRRPTPTAIRDFAQVSRAPVARPLSGRCRPRRSRSSCSSWGGRSRSCGGSSCRRRSCGTAPSRSTRSATCSADAATRSRTTARTAVSSPSSRWARAGTTTTTTTSARCRQGFFWWEIDATFYLLRAMEALGLVWDLHTPPAHIVHGVQREPESTAVTTASATKISSPANIAISP